MTLYEIDNAIRDCIDPETGEVDVEKLESLQEERSEKVENVALWIKNLKADVAAFKAEEEAFKERRKVAENRISSLENYLARALDGKKFETERARVTFRHGQKVTITDEEKIPAQYQIAQPPKIDKAGIREALKGGEFVHGAVLEETISTQVK